MKPHLIAFTGSSTILVTAEIVYEPCRPTRKKDRLMFLAHISVDLDTYAVLGIGILVILVTVAGV